ncbi:hypothetical protein [uncultured Hymenobacter sp.]|uniref:hypothetical protein n=1 Tax=uncultured Hymenobacter sp. TaxID=170016 RepID=UPI0035CA3DF5
MTHAEILARLEFLAADNAQMRIAIPQLIDEDEYANAKVLRGCIQANNAEARSLKKRLKDEAAAP